MSHDQTLTLYPDMRTESHMTFLAGEDRCRS